MISLWGCFPVSSFLNQAFKIYSLTYLNPKPSEESDEKEFPEGAHMIGSKGILVYLESFGFILEKADL